MAPQGRPILRQNGPPLVRRASNPVAAVPQLHYQFELCYNHGSAPTAAFPTEPHLPKVRIPLLHHQLMMQRYSAFFPLLFIVYLGLAGGWSLAQESAVPSTQTTESSALPDLEEGFEWLFDGKSFEGWEGNFDWFRIEQGAIVAGSLEKDIPHNEFLCTRKSFGDFEMKIEAKLRGKGDNAGIQFRTLRIANSTEVSGYQCDVGRAWNRNVWGCLYDESRRNKVLADTSDENLKKWLKPNEWNELTIRAVGSKIELFLNGNPTVSYVEGDEKIARHGVIGLQIHSGPPTEALYRNIRIKSLDESHRKGN